MITIQKKIEAPQLSGESKKGGGSVKMILQIHDELVFELPAAEADKHAKWIAEEMTGAIKLDVPLKVDINYGPTWLK
jgi:DNA polymerase-1